MDYAIFEGIFGFHFFWHCGADALYFFVTEMKKYTLKKTKDDFSNLSFVMISLGFRAAFFLLKKWKRKKHVCAQILYNLWKSCEEYSSQLFHKLYWSCTRSCFVRVHFFSFFFFRYALPLYLLIAISIFFLKKNVHYLCI